MTRKSWIVQGNLEGVSLNPIEFVPFAWEVSSHLFRCLYLSTHNIARCKRDDQPEVQKIKLENALKFFEVSKILEPNNSRELDEIKLNPTSVLSIISSYNQELIGYMGINSSVFVMEIRGQGVPTHVLQWNKLKEKVNSPSMQYIPLRSPRRS